MAKNQKAASTNGWTEELEARLVEMGEVTNEDCKKLALEKDFSDAGKSPQAIRGKAVSLKVYKKTEPQGHGSTRQRPQKSQVIGGIATMLSANEAERESLESLEKANYAALDLIAKKLTQLSDTQEADNS